MTQPEYNALPGLIPRKLFQQISGLNAKDLSAEVRAGRLTVYRRPLRQYRRGGQPYQPKISHAKYYKHQAAPYAGLKP